MNDDELFMWMIQQDEAQLIRVFAKWLNTFRFEAYSDPTIKNLVFVLRTIAKRVEK